MQTSQYRSYISACSAGVNINNLKATDLGSFELFLAPRREQDRIVNEIEKQFTRLDAATAALKRVQANLKRYRASVLKAACEGQLVSTEAELARKEGRDYEPADKLLQRILREPPAPPRRLVLGRLGTDRQVSKRTTFSELTIRGGRN